MALIKCKDCDNEVSDSAESCPKCGAPIVKAVGEDQEQCPFCMSILSADAAVCTGCNAMKGYTHAQGNVYGKGKTIAMGIALPGIIAFIAFGFSSTFSTFVGLFLLIPVILSARRLMKGEIWFRTTNVHNN